MGLALWAGGGVLAFFAARLIPAERRGWWGELTVAIVVALALGLVATSLDFGGWREPDWRAGLFVCFGSFAAAGATRFANLLLRKKSTGGPS